MESVVGNIVKAEKGQRVGSYAKINQKCKIQSVRSRYTF